MTFQITRRRSMKNELKFYSSLPLFILTTSIMWVMYLSCIYFFVICFDAADFWWWIEVILMTSMSIGLPIIIYPRTMSKIYLNETGIKKVVFRESKAQFIKWEDVCDVQILTRPNGYSYVVVSNSSKKNDSFEEVIKDKNVIYFTYNEKAIEFINSKIINKDQT